MGWEGLEEEEEEEEEEEKEGRGKREREVIEGRELERELKSRCRRDKSKEKQSNQNLQKGYSLLRFDIRVPELWVPLESVSVTMPGISTHNYCFVQYKLCEASKTGGEKPVHV